MRRAFLSLLLLVAGCASAQSNRAGPLDLQFKAGAKTPEDISADFAQVMSDRYPMATSAEVIKQDLIGQGMVCRDTPPVEARKDYLVAACDITKAGPKEEAQKRNVKTCDDVWIVSLRYYDEMGPNYSMRVLPTGSFERNCY